MRRLRIAAWRGAAGSLLLGVVLLLACSGGAASRPRAERKPMALKIDVHIVPAEAVFQEAPGCDFTLTNVGAAPVQVVHPGQVDNLPYITLLDLKSGQPLVFQRVSEGFVPPETQPLAPGAKIEWSVDLASHARIPAPGDYDVWLRYPFDEKQIAESEHVRLRVLPSTGRNLALASVSGAPSPVLSAAWVNVATRPARLMRGTFALNGSQPGVEQVRTLATVPENVRPQVSAPPNGSVSRDHWVAWLENGKLKATHYGEGHRPLPVQEIPVSGSNPELLAPLHTSPLTDPEEPPPGSALVRTSGPGGTHLQEVRLLAGGLALGATATMPGPPPLWIRSFTRSNGARLMLYLQGEDRHVRLRGMDWPTGGGGAAPLAEWLGDFVAADAVLDAEDGIRLAVLLDVPVATGPLRKELRLVQWVLDGHNDGREIRRDALEGGASRPIDRAAVWTSGKTVAAIVQGTSGPPHLWKMGAGFIELPSVLGSDERPLGVAFRNEFDPVLIHTTRDHGWEVLSERGAAFAPGHEH